MALVSNLFFILTFYHLFIVFMKSRLIFFAKSAFAVSIDNAIADKIPFFIDRIYNWHRYFGFCYKIIGLLTCGKIFGMSLPWPEPLEDHFICGVTTGTASHLLFIVNHFIFLAFFNRWNQEKEKKVWSIEIINKYKLPFLIKHTVRFHCKRCDANKS